MGTLVRARFTDGNVPDEVMNVKNANPERRMPLVPSQVLKTSGLVTRSPAEATQIIPRSGFLGQRSPKWGAQDNPSACRKEIFELLFVFI